ncbi:histone acetyltransferase [Aureobasidium pullulans]|jgi:histone acetyltransferase|uniref:histone acetyltransferase n=1 Tax=Aureobasidium pullulans TaxID=5580 RepID=A0A4S8ZKB8_AURPU|nr:histone acetyltransferase [Aureobasidium pullulans]THV93197.1 histone acetyltransferase [Aureobasidium pullulans]THW11124.1 histone acetyltransferase [Aureobasidium pullulans]THW20395.1 histone acetyltransferase [Aureobasidium pullulans]THW38830.1 histone acetyltransferase [Aureobasidium pullulans]
MAPSALVKEEGASTAKRKAESPSESVSDSKRFKASTSPTPTLEHDTGDAVQSSAPRVVPFPEKPAVIEERNGEIEFRAVNNDGDRESYIILTGLKCIFQKQLPKMPKDYIARLVYDRTHLSMAIVKKPLEVVGGITYRPFKGRQFAEIVFCAISSDQQVKGYGAHLMSHLKDYVKATSDVMHFLTYADNYAIGYFKKQGFTKEITLERPRWMGYIKDYEGGTIMQCSMLPKIRYLESGRLLLKQKAAVHAKIKAVSKSFEVHPPPTQWKGLKKGDSLPSIDPLTIAAIKETGWSLDMDALARQPRHNPNHSQLMHLLSALQNSTHAWPFLQPVNKDEVLDYYEVIKQPMDLSTMEQKLENDAYETPEDFIRDATLICVNCRRYNAEQTPYHKAAIKLEKELWKKVKDVPEWSYIEQEHFAEVGK